MYLFFFFNDTATTEIYTLSLHDALPIYLRLIVQGQFTALERAAQFALDRVALQDAFGHRGVEEGINARRTALAEVHREIGMTQQEASVGAAGRRERNTNNRPNHDGGRPGLHWLV